MKKIFLVLLVAVSIYTISYTQVKSSNFDLTISDLSKTKYRTLNDVIEGKDGYVYVFLSNFIKPLKYDYSIQKYDLDLNLIKTVPYEIKHKKEDLSYEFSRISKDGQIYLFSEYLNLGSKEHLLYLHKFDKENLTINGAGEKIVDISYKGHNRFQIGKFSISNSQDSTKTLIYYKFPKTNSDYEQFGLIVYDDGMNEMWRKEVELPVKEKMFELINIEVGNNGNVYILSKEILEEHLNLAKYREHKYNIYEYTIDNSDPKIYELETKDNKFTDIRFILNNEDDLLCSGFYSTKKDFSKIAEGVFYMKIDNNSRNILVSEFTELNLAVLQSNTDENTENSKDKSYKSDFKFIVYDLLINNDGGITLVGENYYTTEVSTQNGISIVHFNRNIIVINFASNGNILWTQQIPKFQKTGNKHLKYANFGVHKQNEKIYFIYNDNPNNAYISDNDKVSTFNLMSKKAITMIVDVDKNGNKNKQVSSTYDDINVFLTPEEVTTLPNNQFIIGGGNDKAFKLVKVGFK
jgi:hypothetical protein